MDGKIYYNVPDFTGENVPVDVVAQIMKKDRTYITQGLIAGILPIGTAFKKEGSKQYDYYISPKLLWEFTGYVYNTPKHNHGE